MPSLRVLVAEDDRDTLAVIRLALKKAGCTITAVRDGAAVAPLVANSTPDVVLLDWIMPGMDGIDVCRQLKADPRTRMVPVVFLTGNTDERELRTALAVGAVGYITKPFDPVTLGDTLARLLRGTDPPVSLEVTESSHEVNRSSPSQDDDPPLRDRD